MNHLDTGKDDQKMNNQSRAFRLLPGVFLYLGGIAVSLALSVVMLWGEMEARLYTQQTGDETLHIECPLAIAPWESAAIHTVVTNTLTDQATKPRVNALFSHEKEARLITETLELGPLESRALQWEVDSANIVFDRVILVNILQRLYRDLPSRQGACSILVYSLFGLTGRNTIILLVSMGVLGSLSGAALLFLLYRPFTDRLKNLAQLNGIFLSLILLGLISALTRRWGLTLVFDAAALLAITTGGIEILFSRKK
jgi:hypothetical protein